VQPTTSAAAAMTNSFCFCIQSPALRTDVRDHVRLKG